MNTQEIENSELRSRTARAQLELAAEQIANAATDARLNKKKARWYEPVLAATAAAGLISLGIGIAKLFM